MSLGLTFADFDALKPFVLHVFVTGPSTLLKPSTAGSAATDSAGFLERATLWTPHRIDNR